MGTTCSSDWKGIQPDTSAYCDEPTIHDATTYVKMTKNTSTNTIDYTNYRDDQGIYVMPDDTDSNPVDSTDYARTYFQPGFASQKGVAGKGNIKDWCNAIGAGNEWQAVDGEYRPGPEGNQVNNSMSGPNTHYNDCNNVTQMPTGCCNGCCGIAGRNGRCMRNIARGVTAPDGITIYNKVIYPGEATQCCMRDHVCQDALVKANDEINSITTAPGALGTATSNWWIGKSAGFEPDSIKNFFINGDFKNNNTLPCKDSANCVNPSASFCNYVTSTDGSIANSELPSYQKQTVQSYCNYGPFNPFCFDKNNKTCHPTHRDVTSNNCQPLVSDWCVGNDLDPDSIDWINRWMDGSGDPVPQGCTNAVIRNLYRLDGLWRKYNNDWRSLLTENICAVKNNPYVLKSQQFSPDISYSADGLIWTQKLMDKVFLKYAEAGFVIGTLPGQPGYHPFQDFLYENICQPFPGACESALQRLCAVYNNETLSNNPAASNWCGCHLTDDNYSTYVNRYQITKQCTPLCNRPLTIRSTDQNGKSVNCNSTVCLIDNVTVAMMKTDVRGSINISQYCGQCDSGPGSSASCSCIVENLTVVEIGDTIGGDQVISQKCGSNIQCTTVDPDDPNNVIYYPCGTDDPLSQQQDQQNLERMEKQKRTDISITFIIAVVIFIITLAFIFIKPDFNNPKTYKYEVSAPVNLPPKSRPVADPLSSNIGSMIYGSKDIGSGGFEPSIGSIALGNGSGLSGYSSSIGSSSVNPNVGISSSEIGSFKI